MTNIYVKYGQNGRTLVKELLERLNLAAKLQPSMRFAIKPNLVLAKPSSSGATTDPQVVAGIIEYLHDNNCTNIKLMESSWLGDSTKRAYKVCGYTELANYYNVELIDLKKDKTRTYNIENTDLEVCCSPVDTDFLINVPVLKAHCQTKITCALKNMKGCIPDKEKRRYHTLGLHQPIAYVNKIFKQHLIVVDGLIGDLTFEEGGTPVEMGRVIVGTDPVAIDAYCADLLGYNVKDIPYIEIAEKLGIGSVSYNINELNQAKELDLSPSTLTSSLKEHIEEKQACSACLGSLLHALQRLQEKSGQLPNKKIYIGQGFQDKSYDGIGIGNCTKNFTHSVQGCPPSAKSILELLENIN